jgi:hypothetical protein
MFFNQVFRTFAQPLPAKPATVAASPIRTFGNDAIIIALKQSGKPLSVSDLAETMGCSIGESSKRVKAAQRFLKIGKCGRKKLISLRDLDRRETLALMKTMTPGAYWLTPL